METLTLPDDVAKKLMAYTGKRSTRAAVLAVAEKLPSLHAVVLTEGRKKYRASDALRKSVAIFTRTEAVELTDAQFAVLTRSGR